MSDNYIYRFDSVSQLFEAVGAGKPKHPLIGIIDPAKYKTPSEFMDVKLTGDLYCIILKDGNCGMQYGRNKYDFEEGVLRFLAPNQIVTATDDVESTYGFMLFFHPDLIRNFPLGEEINKYTFFDYSVYEALHLSEKEEKIISC